jgi:mRNA interferase MazF
VAKTRQARNAPADNWPKRGEIYLIALDPAIGREIKKTRPALIIQNDVSNRYSGVTMVAPITSTVRLPLSPLHVLLPAEPSTGLALASVAVFNQIRAVDRHRLIKKLGAVDPLVLPLVDEAIKTAFGLALTEPGLDSPLAITRVISESSQSLKTGRYES